jgi:hypothetical protein
LLYLASTAPSKPPAGVNVTTCNCISVSSAADAATLLCDLSALQEWFWTIKIGVPDFDGAVPWRWRGAGHPCFCLRPTVKLLSNRLNMHHTCVDDLHTGRAPGSDCRDTGRTVACGKSKEAG